MTDASLRAAAIRWRELDPDSAAEVDALLAGDPATLRDAFGATLDFGTGGMRGPMGPGPNRMNAPMIRRVTAALARVLVEDDPDAPGRGVVVGYDGRRHSRAFAEAAVSVLAAAGFRALLAPRPVPTPLVAFLTPRLGAAAGVIVTASHNPPEDNGFKVFAASGAQIVAPLDTRVRAAMDAVGDVPPAAPAPGEPWPAGVLERYLREILGARVRGAAPLRIAYTPVHGVGGWLAVAALGAAGYPDVHVVAEQLEPDGAFPTVRFPNPEEPGVLDRALALGTRVGADVVLANDPDADRLAVAVPDGDGWRVLTGNEVGVLLADDLLAFEARPDDLVGTTIVSTALLSRVAAARGVRCVETLTGFKHLAAAALAHEARGGRFRFGFEESIGYTVGTVVRDKDGISAAVLVADLAARAKAEGRTLLDRLDDLARRHGAHVGRAASVRVRGLDGLAAMKAAMSRLRAAPPLHLAGLAVREVVDVLEGVARAPGGPSRRLDLPSSDVLGFRLDVGRAWVRPSGTEPKIKLYVEIVEAVTDEVGAARAVADARARDVLAALEQALAL